MWLLNREGHPVGRDQVANARRRAGLRGMVRGRKPPPTGNIHVRQRGDLLTATGEILMTVDRVNRFLGRAGVDGRLLAAAFPPSPAPPGSGCPSFVKLL
jgi:hypothetical protein